MVSNVFRTPTVPTPVHITSVNSVRRMGITSHDHDAGSATSCSQFSIDRAAAAPVDAAQCRADRHSVRPSVRPLLRLSSAKYSCCSSST